METRVVPAGNGFRWITAGFALFRKSPLIWIVLTMIMFAIAFVLQFVPVVGAFVSSLLYPIFLAGLMLGCRDLEGGADLEIGHLFAGFQKNAAQLVTIGGVYLVGQIVIIFICASIAGWEVIEIVSNGSYASMTPELRSKFFLFMLIAAAISVPILMVIWFAPLLVAFRNIPPVPAMKLSFLTCLRNVAPFTVYGICYLILTAIALIPFGLGLILVIPLVFPTIYASYIDIFGNNSVDQT